MHTDDSLNKDKYNDNNKISNGKDNLQGLAQKFHCSSILQTIVIIN